MKKKLQMLEQLQATDLAVDVKLAQQAGHRGAITALEQELAQARAALEAEQQRLAALEQDKAELEAAMQIEQDNIKRSESHMKAVSTNKEYQAVGREITAARKQIGEQEEQILQLTAQGEELDAAIATRLAAIDELTQRYDAARAESESLVAALQGEVDAATAQRDELVKGIGTAIMRRYSQLREQRRGQALAEARDGSCQVCNMQLPPQLYNILYRGEELNFCPHCQRILYLRQEEAQQ